MTDNRPPLEIETVKATDGLWMIVVNGNRWSSRDEMPTELGGVWRKRENAEAAIEDYLRRHQ